MDLGALYRINAVLADTVFLPGFGARWIWWTTLAHLVTFCLCLLAEKKERPLSAGNLGSKRPNFWFVLALFVLAFCLNKLFFNVQEILMQFLRKTAKVDGWYDQRRTMQVMFLVAVAAVGLILFAASIYCLRNHWRQRGSAFIGATFLLILFVTRTVSYHPTDNFLYRLPVVKDRMNASLELGCSFLIGLGAFLASREKPHAARQQS